MGLADFAGGVQDALRQMVADRIQRQQLEQQQKMAEARQRLAESQLGIAASTQRLAEGRFDREGEQDAEDKRRYDAEAPLRAAELQGRIQTNWNEAQKPLEPEIKRQAEERKQKFEAEQADIERKHQLSLEGVRQAGRADKATRRPMLSSDANRIAELDTSLDDADVLEQSLSTPGATGLRAQVGASVIPNAVTEFTGWGADAKSRRGTIDLVKQVIGKALEGGVLRKEDEYKYTKILPTIKDPPEVAISKLQGLKVALQQRRQRAIEALADAGFDTSKFEGRTADGDAPQPGEEGEIDGVPVVWDGHGWLPK